MFVFFGLKMLPLGIVFGLKGMGNIIITFTKNNYILMFTAENVNKTMYIIIQKSYT